LCSRTRSTSSTRRVMWYCYTQPSTNKPCDATTSATCAPASSKSGTWSFDNFKVARIDADSRPHGRGHSSLIRYSNPERLRSDTKMIESPPTLGTSSTCGHFTLE
jgi:hypothetical protein